MLYAFIFLIIVLPVLILYAFFPNVR